MIENCRGSIVFAWVTCGGVAQASQIPLPLQWVIASVYWGLQKLDLGEGDWVEDLLEADSTSQGTSNPQRTQDSRGRYKVNVLRIMRKRAEQLNVAVAFEWLIGSVFPPCGPPFVVSQERLNPQTVADYTLRGWDE